MQHNLKQWRCLRCNWAQYNWIRQTHPDSEDSSDTISLCLWIWPWACGGSWRSVTELCPNITGARLVCCLITGLVVSECNMACARRATSSDKWWDLLNWYPLYIPLLAAIVRASADKTRSESRSGGTGKGKHGLRPCRRTELRALPGH